MRRTVERGAGGRRAAVALVVLALAGCASEPASTSPPVVVGVPIEVPSDVARAGLLPTPPPTPTPGPVASVTPTPAPTVAPSPTGPTAADAVAYIAADDTTGATGVEHVVVDVDGDEVDEVVMTAMVRGAGYVRVAWWDGETFGVTDDGVGGRGRVVERLQVADVNDDGNLEVLLRVSGDGRSSVAVWTVPGRGSLFALSAVGGCHDGSHVYGVVGARLVATAAGPLAIVATCDDSPLPVADWSEQRWTWRDGAYRVVEPLPEPAPEPTQHPTPIRSPSPDPTPVPEQR